MKKILLLLSIICLSSGSGAFASCEYQCTVPYDTNSKTRTILGAVTGVNLITEKAAERALKKEILKLGSAEKLNVNINSYSSKDMKNGIFKSAEINAQEVEIKGVYLSSIKLKTLCDFNYIKPLEDDAVVMEDLPMTFSAELTGEDINKTMQHSKYQKVINGLNQYGFGFKVNSTKAAIQNDKFYYIINFEIPFVKRPQQVVLEANVSVKNGEIVYTNTRMDSGFAKLETQKLNSILNYLNPLDFSINIINNKEALVKVKNVEIQNNTILTDGIVVIPKD